MKRKIEDFQKLGIVVVGKKPNADGWIPCHAIDREDQIPSAAVNLKTGRYRDHGGDGLSLSFSELVARQ